MWLHPGHQHMPAAQGWPARTWLLWVRVVGAPSCACETPLTRDRACARAGAQAPTQPRWPVCLTWTPDLCLRGLPAGAQPLPKAGTGISLEEVPSPYPGLGLSLLEVPHGVKAHRAVPWEADFFLMSPGTCTFTQAGRVQLPAKGCSTRHGNKHSAPSTADGTLA